MISDLIKVLEPISRVFNALLHPLETITALTEYILLFIPPVCTVIFLFYIVTGSKKALNSMFFVTLAFILLKAAIVFDFMWLIGVLVAAIIIIRLVGYVT